MREHLLIERAGLKDAVERLAGSDEVIDFSGIEMNGFTSTQSPLTSYDAPRAGRQILPFETVMSSPDKVAFLRPAREAGYRRNLPGLH